MTNQDVDADLNAQAQAATLQAMGYTIEVLTAENDSLRAQLDQRTDALAEIKHLEAECERLRAEVPRWVPVGERLPETIGSYLVYGPLSEPHINEIAWAFFNSKNDWCDATGYFSEGVTYWQPLPPTPSKEQNDDQ